MKEKLLRELTVKSVLLMLVTVLLSYGIETASIARASYGESTSVEAAKDLSESTGKLYTNLETKETKDSLSEPYLVIEKPEEKSYEVSLEDLYMEKSIRLSIQNLREKNFTRGSLLTGSENESTIERVRLTYEYEPASFLYTCIFEVELDSVYAYQLYEDDTAIYVELWEPSKLYDKVIVVDAGHGGNDIGTYSLDMQYYEKDINLNITKDLKALLDKEDIKVYYTRLSDEKVYLNPRVDLANEIRADFFISIHANSGETTKAKGCEVLYGTTEESDTSFNSKKLASLCLKAMTSGRELANRGIVENNEIYIIGKSKVPIALIEVGFMTNEEDLEYIVDRSNQKKMAEYIYNGIMAAFSELKKQ